MRNIHFAMTKFLPPNLLSLFFPREPLPFKPPPKKKKCPKAKKMFGLAAHVDLFEEHTSEVAVVFETRPERIERKARERQERATQVLEERKTNWEPKNNTDATTDPYKTLFLGRLSYETTEARLKRDFEIYGPIRQIRVVNNKFTGKPRGYGFIEYEHTRDMHAAYKHMDGKKLEGKRIVVDAERGRAERNWLPRYLGGGLGGQSRMIRKAKSEPPTHRTDSSNDRRSKPFEHRDRGDCNAYRDRYKTEGALMNSVHTERRRSTSRQESHRRPRDDDSRHPEKDRKH